MEIKNLERIGQGLYAEVFRIGEDVLKCPFMLNYSTYPIREEFEMQKQLFVTGIKVPEPYEIIEVQLRNRTVEAIRMKFIDGINAEKVRKRRRERVEKLYYQELNKAISKGFLPYDEDLHNAIYLRNNEICLIDFDNWRCIK